MHQREFVLHLGFDSKLAMDSFIFDLFKKGVEADILHSKMHLTPSSLYALRLSLHQNNASSIFRKNVADRSTTTSAVFLATVGLSLSMFSLKQMLSSPAHQRRLRRLH